MDRMGEIWFNMHCELKIMYRIGPRNPKSLKRGALGMRDMPAEERRAYPHQEGEYRYSERGSSHQPCPEAPRKPQGY